MEMKFIDEKLCTVELHAPTQERKAESFTLFSVLAFDVRAIPSGVDGDNRTIRYGFREAELRLQLSNCTIAAGGRLIEALPSIQVHFEEHLKKNRAGELQGNARAGFTALGLIGAGTSTEAKTQKSYSSTTVESGASEKLRMVIRPYNRYWRIYGIKNSDGLLNGTLTGETPLCNIVHNGENCSVMAEAVVDLRNLVVTFENGGGGALHINRKKVIAALIAKRLGPRQSDLDIENESGSVILASHKLPIRADNSNEP